MALERIAFAGYRCFAQRQNIELRPITVVLGRNNSGKSALVRTPLVLSAGIRTESRAPLDLDILIDKFSLDMVESFTDLIYGGRPHGSIDIEADLADGDYGFAATVQNIDEYRAQVVSSLRMRSRHGEVQLDWVPDDPPAIARYTVRAGERTRENVLVAFEGLLPSAESEEPLTTNPLRGPRIRDSFPDIRYLGPFRDLPGVAYRLPSGMPADVGTVGQNAGGILASDLVRGQGRLLRQVNQDIADILPGWTLDMVERGRNYAVLLRSRDDDTLSVNLADAGTGVAQMLPIFVQRAADLVSPPRRPVLEIIEQPELHLHPAAHGALADLYLTAVQRSDVRFLIETHSETFLLRLRRRIAEGLDPDMIAIYFVEHGGGASNVRRIKVDADGNLDSWPEGVFSEDYEEVRALASAQLDRRDTDAG